MAQAAIDPGTCTWTYDAVSQVWISKSHCASGYGCVDTSGSGKSTTGVKDADLRAGVAEYNANHGTQLTVPAATEGNSVEMPCVKL